MFSKTRKIMNGGKQTHPDLIEGQRYRVFFPHNNETYYKGVYAGDDHELIEGEVFAKFTDVTLADGTHEDLHHSKKDVFYEMFMFEPISEGGRRRVGSRKHRKGSRKNTRKANMRRRR